MDLNEILVFARVARTGSFTTAAAELGMPKSTVSRKITELETRLKRAS
jgi:DNA-binding transcriptional LysR family regulator